jgi:acetyltransferase-like isoleucine patch superfamily enzyme
MKQRLLGIVEWSARVVGCIVAVTYPRRMQLAVTIFRNRVRSYAVAPQFRRFGKGAYVGRDVVLVNPGYVSIGSGASLGERTVVTAWDRYEGERFTPEIVIGDNTSIGAECHLTAIGRIVIGNGVLTGKKITITDNSHGACMSDELDTPPIRRRLVSKGPVVIGDHVWIGDKVTILPGVRIGRGAIIAANAVVSSDVPEGCVAAGIPAKVIKNMLGM